jgi:hypothetical protein
VIIKLTLFLTKVSNPNSLLTRYVEFYLWTKDTHLRVRRVEWPIASFQVGSRPALAHARPS